MTNYRWTEEDLKKFMGDNARRLSKGQAPAPLPTAPKTKMNKTETRYANWLWLQQCAGEIDRYRFEAIKFILADNTTIKPDFYVVRKGRVEIHECKGNFVREDSWVKLKIAAALFPEFKFFLCQWIKGEWIIKEVPNGTN